MKRPELYVALDFSSGAEALKLVERTMAINPCFKVGLELYVSEGPELVRELSSRGASVFLDLKFHDIPNTVAGAARAATRLNVKYFNVHCGGGSEMMKAAVRARDEEASRLGILPPKLLGVTVLTSLDDSAIQEIGFQRSVSAQVKQFVELAQSSGLDGVVCSPQELALVRQLAGPNFITMVPGIRPSGAKSDDQKRTLSPKEASAAGAHCLVVGRPVTAAADPATALQQVLAEL